MRLIQRRLQWHRQAEDDHQRSINERLTDVNSAPKDWCPPESRRSELEAISYSFVVVEELSEFLIQLASITVLATFPGPIYIACTSTNCHQGHLTRGYTLSYQKRKAIPTSAALIINLRYWQILLCIAKVKGNWKRSIEAKYPSYTSFCSMDRRRGIVLVSLQLPRWKL